MNNYANSNPTVFLDLTEVFTSEKTEKEMFLCGRCNECYKAIKYKRVMLLKACLMKKCLSTIYCMLFSHGDNF